MIKLIFQWLKGPENKQEMLENELRVIEMRI
jgi:hypothetical protein